MYRFVGSAVRVVGVTRAARVAASLTRPTRPEAAAAAGRSVRDMSMRRAVDGLVVLAVVGAAGFMLVGRQSGRADAATGEDVQRSLARLYERASYYGALDKMSSQTPTLWPVVVRPEWFGDEPPTNGLLSGSAGTPHGPRPWIDVAPPGDREAHPPDPVAVRRGQAQFWYNPNLGVFRARVAPTLREDEALTLYNRLNGVTLTALHRDTDPRRKPLAYTPGRTPGTTQATLAPPGPSPQRLTPEAPLHVSLPEATDAPPKPIGRARLKDR
ncbi:MAG: hypothetical protein AAF800_08645 [Planctomycetota bacterium]